MPAKRKAVPQSASRVLRHSQRAVAALSHANRNLHQAARLAVTAGKVVNARMTTLDHSEFARMVPEKVIASSAAGTAGMHAAMRMVAQLYQDATGEGIAAMVLMQKIATARTPFAVIALQQQAAYAALGRMATRAFAAGQAMLHAQTAMAAPIASAANANARRLAG